MTTKSNSAAPAAEAVGADETAMFKVTLKSAVSLYGFLFKPGQDITVNKATVTLMGDAVDHAEQV